MTAKVHVVILNWNGWQDTLECLDTLLKQEGVDLEMIVVDNGSQNDSVIRIRERYPTIQILETGKNMGYPGGMNTGIRAALARGAEYIFILNNDTLADPQMVKHLLAEVSNGAGIAAPAIFYAGEPERIWSIGGKIQPVLLEMAAPHGGDIPLPSGPTGRGFFTGCAMLVSAAIFRQVGLFDERFYPGYYEDLDFCVRVWRSGYRMVLVPQARLWHKISRSSGGQFSPRVYYLMARNSGYYFRKHMRLWQAPFILAFRLGSALKTTLRLILRRDRAGLAAYWSGLARGWTGLYSQADARYLPYYG